MLAPPSPTLRPGGFFKRVYDAAMAKPAAVSPYKEVGVSGTSVQRGFVQTRERSSAWSGRQRYVTVADMATNTSIIAAGVHYFLNLIAHPQWTVQPADESDEAKKAAELVEEALHGMDQPWSRVVRRAGTYLFHGFGTQEWTARKEEDGSVGLESVEARPQYTIEQWVLADNGKVEGVWQRNPINGELIGLPRSKLLYLVEDSLTDSPEGLGLFRHLAEPWERLKAYYKLETIAFERDLRGIPVGRVPYTLINEAVKDGRLTQDQADAAISGMEEFVKLQVKQADTSITLDSLTYVNQSANGDVMSGVPQWGLELVQGSGTGVEALSPAIIRTQTEMARILACEHLMMGESSGNRALGEDKSRNLYLVANSVLEDITMGVTHDIVHPLCLLNGIKEELYPYCEAEDVAFKSAQSVAATLVQMAQAGAVLAPDDPVVEEVRSLMGVAPPKPVSPEMAGMLPGMPGTEQPPATDEEATAAVDEANAPAPAEEADAAGVQKFDPSQPRDDRGRWTDGGAAGAVAGALTGDMKDYVPQPAANASELFERTVDKNVTADDIFAAVPEAREKLDAVAK